MMPLAVLAMLVGSAVAMFERNLKRLFAYSSVAQIGYIILGVSLVNQAGLTASVLHMFNHEINVAGTLFTLQAVARHMIDRGIKGRIINMASQAGRRGEPLVAVYCATKAAVISLTQSAGLNLIQHGINVNAISPGVVDGEHWDGVDAFFAKYENKAPGTKKKEVGAAVPYGRMGTAEDQTGMAVFLASDAADYIVAQTYNVDGGQWMS